MANGNGSVGQQIIPVPRPGGVSRTSGTGQELEYRAETASSAVAERARATVEARFVMARRFPRDMDRARQTLLKACNNPSFAEVAIYHKPVGEDGIRGPSIRMAEEIARCMGNITTDVTTVYDDQQKTILEVSACDLESNLTHPQTVLVQKTVERRKVREGQVVRGQRMNSFGDTVFIVEATDDEMLNKTGALTSKALRTCLLRLAPDWLLSEAMRTAMKTREDEDAKDPDATRKSIIDGFGQLGVDVAQVTEYIGHGLEALTPKEINELRGLYAAIRDGEATWQEAIEFARRKQGDDKPPAAPPANLGEAAARAKAEREGKAGQAPEQKAGPAGEQKKITIETPGAEGKKG